MFQNIGEIVKLLWRTLLALPRAWRQRQKVMDQFFEIGNASLLMVCLLSFFIGAVICLNFAPPLMERSFTSAIGGVVGLAIALELAPVMMAILIAGRIGSAMAAEIGSMQVYQEIDALRTMDINPVDYLVLPRLVAISAALPLLVVFSVLVGWVGGAAVADHLGIPFQVFFADMKDLVALEDVVKGVFKSFCFAILIGVISCHQGLTTIGGPRGIGRSVTKAVVNSIVLIVLFDYLLTLFMRVLLDE